MFRVASSILLFRRDKQTVYIEAKGRKQEK